MGLAPASVRTRGRILSGGAFVAAITAVTSLLNVLILAAIGRELGAGGLGVFGVASALGTYVFVLGAFGTTQIITREVAQGDESGRNFLALVVTRAAFVVLTALVGVVATSVTTALLIANVTATLLVDLAMAVYYGQGRSVTAGITLGAYRGAALVAIPVLIVSHSLQATAAALLTVTVAVSVPPLLSLRHRLCHEQGCRQPLPELLGRARLLWRRGAPLALWAGLDAAVGRGDVAILGLVASPVVTGQYVAAATMMLGFASVGIAISYVLLPALARQDERAARETLRRLLAVIVPGFVVGGLALALLAPSLVSVVYGSNEEYRDATAVFRILVLFLPVVVGGRCLQIALVARGRDRAVLVTQLLGAATMVVGCTVGYRAVGVNGAALATAFAYVVIAASAAIAMKQSAHSQEGSL